MSNTEKKPIKIIVYADLNCPYCYALNERLEQLGMSHAASWRPIEHAPDIHKHNFTSIDKQELAQEVNDIISKDPNLILNLPNFRPNSNHASKLLATVIQHYPEKEVECRTLFYRALWQQGLDISDANTLNDLLASIAFADLTITKSANNALLAWYDEWKSNDFTINIPRLESSNGFTLLGLPPIKQLDNFMQHGWSKVSDFQDASCISSERYSIAVISEKPDSWSKPQLLEATSRYQFYPTEQKLIELTTSDTKLDMIVLHSPSCNAVNTIKTLKESALLLSIPIFLLSDNEGIQVEAYRAGVAEIAPMNTIKEVLGHRMINILHAKRSTEKLYEIARIDFLTGLYNRREFNTVIEKEWRQCMRENTPISLLMIDLDSFKAYNDTYGHSMGDEVLRRFAQILKSCTKRSTDLTVRYGGEEFAIILPNVDKKGAIHVAELICKQTELHEIEHITSPVRPHITASIGVTEAQPATNGSIMELISQTDKALYKAKENGRNQVFSFDP